MPSIKLELSIQESARILHCAVASSVRYEEILLREDKKFPYPKEFIESMMNGLNETYELANKVAEELKKQEFNNVNASAIDAFVADVSKTIERVSRK